MIIPEWDRDDNHSLTVMITVDHDDDYFRREARPTYQRTSVDRMGGTSGTRGLATWTFGPQASSEFATHIQLCRCPMPLVVPGDYHSLTSV